MSFNKRSFGSIPTPLGSVNISEVLIWIVVGLVGLAFAGIIYMQIASTGFTSGLMFNSAITGLLLFGVALLMISVLRMVMGYDMYSAKTVILSFLVIGALIGGLIAGKKYLPKFLVGTQSTLGNFVSSIQTNLLIVLVITAILLAVWYNYKKSNRGGK